ncbi:asparagine synthase (glutamine-hydrolyzing) [Pigmentiphaga sp. GD03639]|uniref:asparagine synthase (glutamine-hydrolyzing) n=1 Tax=Pigmentiphaga sp. GD03639 TaxID=2975354 RepID=UPI00244B79CA|nr:asparagine synthase (glutamine-hydrolyzing) [Pigmentiphaga sp. GD03639]MDH2239847.1 asparagine synthase (glutamine-hydrolyzing) [Pigmentiphaga sp. GD03639]
MCGIFGAFTFGTGEVSISKLDAMAHSISHRGPDAKGHFSDSTCALGNCRLSIVDLSSASNQPIFSNDKSIVVVQNGEIYNYIELREELRRHGARFATAGDTEVILRAYETWGPRFVEKLNGMFAIAIYDATSRTLRLYRDRLGVKPLYITQPTAQQPLWFASELKAILATGYPVQVDHDAIAQYFALNYIPQPYTAFQGIHHLPPGHVAEINASGSITLTRYWDLADISPDLQMTEAEAKAGIISYLDDATRIRLRSDAPFGAFLSGGLDSSSVVAFMSLYQTEAVRSFSIGFDDPAYDETRFAHMASRRFGTLHQAKSMVPDTTHLWPRFIWHCDQPHGDVSFIPTDQVSAMASKDVKMVLTGDGGDELFAGYEKYLNFFQDKSLDSLEQNWVSQYARFSGLLMENQAATLLAGELKDAFHDSNPYRALTHEMNRVSHQDPINKVLFGDTAALLPGNNLVKPDRMAMANSLEVRSPFLDYRLAEFAFRIPGHMKLASGETKAIYKAAVAPLLGNELTYRKKQMFTVPIGNWFRNELADYCRSILLDGRLEARKLFNIQAVRAMVEAHLAGKENHTRQLRALISLEIWSRLFIDSDHEMISRAIEPVQGA